jgi:hypothetical protein
MTRLTARGVGVAFLALACLLAVGSCAADDDDADRGPFVPGDDDGGGGGTTDDDDAGDDSGDDDTAGGDVLVIYDIEAADAQDLAAFLDGLGYTATAIKQRDLTEFNVGGYDMIVLTGDTTWSNLPRADLVMNAGSRIFGFYWGAARFYDNFGLTFGFAGGTTFDGITDVEVVDPGDSMWTGVTVPESGVVTLFTNANRSCHARNIPAPPSGVDVFGYVGDVGPFYTSLGVEDGRYFYWGYETRVADLTADGEKILENAFALLAKR